MERIFTLKFLKTGTRCILPFVYLSMRLKINVFLYIERKGFWKEEMGLDCGISNRDWLGRGRGFLFLTNKGEVSGHGSHSDFLG